MDRREGSMSKKVHKTDAEWRAQLTPEQYRVMREKGTERPHTGKYAQTTDAGTYRCAGMRRAAVRVRDEVRCALRMAELHGADRGHRRRGARGSLARHATHRSALRELRRASRPRVPGWARVQPGCATASTRPRSSWRRSRRADDAGRVAQIAVAFRDGGISRRPRLARFAPAGESHARGVRARAR